MPRRVRFVPIALGSLIAWPLAVACGDKKPEAPAAAPATPAPEAPAPEIKAAPPAPVVEVPVAPPDEWLVWISQDGGFTTRWIDGSLPDAGLVAERKTLIVSDGTRLLHVNRDDGEVDIMDYECADGPAAKCEVTATLTVPGLQATDLSSGTKTGVYRLESAGATPDGGAIYGDGITLTLDVVGGIGSQLWIRGSEDGYYGGAHGEVSSRVMVLDMVDGKAGPMAEQLVPRAGMLPAAVRKESAQQLTNRLEDCGDDVPSLEELFDEKMLLAAVRLALVDGRPRMSWEHTADTFFACSPDYMVHAEVSSEQLDVAELGVETLPAGVQRAITHLNSAPAIGWAKLTLSGEARTAALAAFKKAPVEPWPPAQSSDRALLGAETKHKDAMRLVGKGRHWTRDKDFEAAILAFDDAIVLEENLASAWSGRGHAKMLANQLDDAEADLEQALRLDEGAKFQAMVLYNLGLVAEKRGDKEAAKKAYAESLALRDDKTVREVLEILKAE